MKKVNLNGKWNLMCVKTGKNFEVCVPCDNYTQLLNAGEIPDPFYKDNESKVQWIGTEDWGYSRKFTLTEEELSKRKVLLSCDSLDTLCDVFLNGEKIGEGNNAHIKYEFDIKDTAKVGENELKIIFRSPVEFALKRQKEAPLPKNCNGTDGIAYIRKPHCHFGWDWGISAPLSGILGDICVEAFDSRIEYLDIRQIHENGTVTLKISAEIEGDGEYTGKVICPDGTEIEFAGDSDIHIPSPSLWWTRELSGKEKQPLYTVTATLDGETVTKRIGLRTVRLNRDKDEFGGTFCIELNGVPIFAKGANYIIPDALIGRATNETVDYYLDSAIAANFNILRVWGGANYGSDYFYSQCDEKGILIWQDFMYACLMYPFYEEDFLENCLAEARQNVKRIRNHPSLALLCGNNELEVMFSYMPETMKIVKWYKKFFYEILADEVKNIDADIPYIPTSPIGEECRKGVTGDAFGDTHMWNVWHGLKPLNYYRKRMTRFCSEFGLESLPSMDAVRTFAEECDWGIETEIFNAHQKCKGGNPKMLFYLYEKFNEPEKFEDLIYLTGLIQKECIADATEHWRRNRGRCNGSIFWQYNDNWPAPSWASVDYTGKWKPLQYCARHFFEPVCVSVEDRKDGFSLYCINDSMDIVSGIVKYSLCALDGKTVFRNEISTVLDPLSSKLIINGNLHKADPKDIYLNVKFFVDGKCVSERTKIFVPDKDLKLKKADIKKSVSYENGLLTVKLSADTFCRSVMVDIENFKTPFSDNYFDLLPGEEKVITVKTDKEYDENDVTVKSLCDVPIKGNSLKSSLFRMKFAVKPENIANSVWYSTN